MRLPRARAAAIPARVRSLISDRSNSAIDARTCSRSRPAGVPVSKLSLNDRNSTPRSLRSRMSLSNSKRDRPKRSRRQTTMVSPRRSFRSRRVRPGLVKSAPEYPSSVRTSVHPAALSADICKSRLCSTVLTRAYPKVFILPAA
ncbi:hypothetical protein D3C80_587350 [compost metagenome]